MWSGRGTYISIVKELNCDVFFVICKQFYQAMYNFIHDFNILKDFVLATAKFCAYKSLYGANQGKHCHNQGNGAIDTKSDPLSCIRSNVFLHQVHFQREMYHQRPISESSCYCNNLVEVREDHSNCNS